MAIATFELPDPDGSFMIEGILLKPAGALNGQALVYDSTTNSFIPGANNGTITGSVGVGGQIPFGSTTANSVTSTSLFTWDNTNTRLGIGISSPSYALHTVGDGYFTSRLMLVGSSSSLSPTGTGALRFNIATNHLEFSENGGSWTQLGSSTAIGNAVTGGLNKSILFVDSYGNLAQDNANFTYDSSIHKLTVGGHISVDGYTIDLSAGASTNQVLTYNGTSFVASNATGGLSGTLTSPFVPYATGASTLANSAMSWDNLNKILTITTISGNTALVVNNGGTPAVTSALSVTASAGQFGTTSNNRLEFYTNNSAAQMTLSTGGQLRVGSGTPNYQLDVAGDGYFTSRAIINGSTAAVGPIGSGAIRFNSGTNHLEFSENGGAWTQFGSGSGSMAIGGAVTSGLPQSVLYIDGYNDLAQDNTHFVWDYTNHRLGIGTGAPTAQLHNVQIAQTTGSPNMVKHVGGAHTTLNAAEAIDGYFQLDRTVQFNGGSFTTQRAVYISAPTYNFTTFSTITNAATFAVSGAPIAGPNASIANSYSIWAQSGIARFDGHINVDGYLISLSSGASNGQAIVYNSVTQAFVPQTISSGVGTTGQKFYTIVPAAFNASNGTTTALTVGAFRYDPTNYVLSGTTQSIVFRAIAANGSSTVVGHVKLRDVTNSVDITTFTLSAGTTSDTLFEQTLTTGAIPGSNVIVNSAAIYEVRIYVDSPVSSNDFVQLYSSEMRNIQTIN